MNKNGTGNASIYGGHFYDESFMFHHDNEGMLSMANSGVDTNGSQFFVTTEQANYLDFKHVVFGRVAEGMDVIREVELLGQKDGKPIGKCVVEDCGVLSE